MKNHKTGTITVKDGLLWRNGEYIKLPEADIIARQRGFAYAEQLVNDLENKKKGAA